MSPNTGAWRKAYTFLIIILILSVTSVAAAQKKPKRSQRTADTDVSNILRPQLVNGDTLRFPVMSLPGSVFSITYGWFDISSSMVRYTVAQPTSKSNHSFEVSRSSVADLRLNRTVLSFKSPKKRQMLVFLPQERWGSVHTGPGMGAAANTNSLGTSSIYKTLLNYEAVLAMVKPPPPPPPPAVAPPVIAATPEPKAAPPSPPAIVLSAPSGAGGDQVVETGESSVVIRGVAMDRAGIPVVTINGQPVNMRPQTSQAAEFWSDTVSLQPGGNRIEVVACNASHLEAKLVFLIHYTPRAAPVQLNPRALAKQDIISLLQGGVSSSRVGEIVKDRGLKFSPTAQDVSEIRSEGGNDDLIVAIQTATPHP
jgi:hypothetical protein